jgi:putative heme transporter
MKPQATQHPTSRQQLIRRVVIGVSVVCLALAAVLGRDILRDAASSIGDVSVSWWLVMASAWLVWSVIRLVLQRAVLDRVGWRTAAMMSEAGDAANWLPTGGFGSFAVRTAIGRSRGQTISELTVGFALLREGLATGMWLIVAATSLRDFRRGTADNFDRLGIVAAATGLAVTLGLAFVIVFPNRATAWLLRLTERLCARLARRFPQAASFDIASVIAEARTEAAAIIRRRGPILVALGAAKHVAGATVLWAALRGLKVDIGVLSVIGIYMPITAAVGFTPTPNGVGFAEGGLVAAFVASGATIESGVGAVALYRLFTGVVPMAFGSIVYLWWLRTQRVVRLPA